MTLYVGNRKIHDLDTRGVFYGGNAIKQIYKGSQKLFQQKKTVTITVTHYNASGGSVSGNNFWTSTIDTYNATKTGTITYPTDQKAGTWTINYSAYRQQHTADVYFAIDIAYTDGTSARVYYKDDFPNDNNTHTYTGTFYASKPWRSYTITFNDRGTYNVYVYSGLGAINYITTTYQEIQPV